MSQSLPGNFKLQFNRDRISAAIETIAAPISDWARDVYAQTNQDILCVPILRGGIFFFADLVRSVNQSVQVNTLQAQSYVTEINGQALEHIKITAEDLDVTNRSVLLVDDICDSGRTLQKLEEYLIEKGAAGVRAAVLVKRDIDQDIYAPEYIGFSYSGSEWFVGYGMDDCGRWRNLPDIYIIQK